MKVIHKLVNVVCDKSADQSKVQALLEQHRLQTKFNGKSGLDQGSSIVYKQKGSRKVSADHERFYTKPFEGISCEWAVMGYKAKAHRKPKEETQKKQE